MLPEESMTADASPMITAYYEAYLDMRKMLVVLAELRGDDPQDALEQARAPSRPVDRCGSESAIAFHADATY